MKNKKKELREWILFTVMLMFGIFLLQFTANIATAVPANWIVNANILSDRNPDQEFTLREIAEVQPIMPEIMTPPAWDLQTLLTVEPGDNAQSTIVPVVSFHQSPTPSMVFNPQARALDPTEQTNQGNGELNTPTAQANLAPTTVYQGILITPSPTGSIFLPSYTASPTLPSTPTMAVIIIATSTPGPTMTSTLAQSQPPSSATPTPPNNRPTREPKPTKEPNPGNGGGGGKGNKK